MTRCVSLFLLLFVLLSSSVLPVMAADADGTVVTESATVPDAPVTELSVLEEINNTLGVIQSQLWIILVVGLLGYVYKFFRMFF